MLRDELQPSWLPRWAFNFAMCGVSLGLTLALWPLMTAACLADLLTADDPRLDGV